MTAHPIDDKPPPMTADPGASLILPSPDTVDAGPVELAVGRVTGQAPSNTERVRLAIDIAGASVSAVRAASCLLVPEENDTVLVARPAVGDGFVLAVLTRAGGAATLSVTDATRTTLMAAELALHATALETRSDTLSVEAHQARLAVAALRVVGRTVSAVFHKIETVCTELNTMAETAMLKAVNAMRSVDNLDTTTAGNIVTDAKQTLTIRTEQGVIAAAKDLRIDGERINMG